MTGNTGDEVVVVKSNMIPVGVSARHVHLSRNDLITLFGDGCSLLSSGLSRGRAIRSQREASDRAKAFRRVFRSVQSAPSILGAITLTALQ